MLQIFINVFNWLVCWRTPLRQRPCCTNAVASLKWIKGIHCSSCNTNFCVNTALFSLIASGALILFLYKIGHPLNLMQISFYIQKGIVQVITNHLISSSFSWALIWLLTWWCVHVSSKIGECYSNPVVFGCAETVSSEFQSGASGFYCRGRGGWAGPVSCWGGKNTCSVYAILNILITILRNVNKQNIKQQFIN